MHLFPIYVKQQLLVNIKLLRENDYNIDNYILLLLTRKNNATETANYQEFYRSLRVNIFKDNTIKSST